MSAAIRSIIRGWYTRKGFLKTPFRLVKKFNNPVLRADVSSDGCNTSGKIIDPAKRRQIDLETQLALLNIERNLP